MKKIRITVKITAALLAIVIPFLSVLFIAFISEPEFENHYANALGEKMDRLMEIKEDKIVIVGGSSVAFGYDSEIIEEYTGMPVVNFGMYAALGTKLMLDLSRAGIKKGDIVIVAPELDPQTLSMFCLCLPRRYFLSFQFTHPGSVPLPLPAPLPLHVQDTHL